MSRSDRRFSSYAREIDAAIERVVTHFEDNDVALRLDVLRGLTTHANLAFETERLKQRLLQHPVAKELVERVTTQSRVYERLHRALAVDDFGCDYDRQRDVEIRATVRWTLPEGDAKKSKKNTPSAKRRARMDVPLYMRYAFTRAQNGDGETVVTYAVGAGVGDAEVKELVRYEVASESRYPRSFYEQDQEMESDEEEEMQEEEEEVEEEEEGLREPTAEEEPSDQEGADKEGDDMDEFGEQIRSFDFDDKVLDAVLDWLDAEREQLDPADVIGFFLSVPVYEDEWMVDERVCQILFNSGAIDSEMEEEEVSDFDDEGGEGEEEEQEEQDVEVADLD